MAAPHTKRMQLTKRDSMKKRPPWTPTYKISALRQLHPLVVRRRLSRPRPAASALPDSFASEA